MSGGKTYCEKLVRAQDPDRYLLSMVMPPEHRAALWALFAFNHEIAKTREIVTETQLGLIRLQWWREALEGVYARGEVPEHEVLQGLARAIKTYDLPQQLFEDLLYAREFDLEDVLPSSLAGLIKYAEFTSVPLNRLALKILGQEADMDEAVLRAVSIRYAVTGLLRAMPYHCGQRRCFVPEDMMAAAGIRLDQYYDFKAVEALSPVVREIVGDLEAQSGEKPLQGYLKAAQAMSDLYLKQIKKADGNVFDGALKQPPAFFHLRFFLGIIF